MHLSLPEYKYVILIYFFNFLFLPLVYDLRTRLSLFQCPWHLELCLIMTETQRLNEQMSMMHKYCIVDLSMLHPLRK
jgi:hypothetical protein